MTLPMEHICQALKNDEYWSQDKETHEKENARRFQWHLLQLKKKGRKKKLSLITPGKYMQSRVSGYNQPEQEKSI